LKPKEFRTILVYNMSVARACNPNGGIHTALPHPINVELNCGVKKMGQLYKISFKTSGKSYIGISSVSAEHRFKLHSTKLKNLIGSAFKEYGIDDAVLTILAEEEDFGVLCKMEMTAIIEHNSKIPHGYNMTSGGQGVTGRVCTEEQKKARSEITKSYIANNPEEWIKNRAKAKASNSTQEARKSKSEQIKIYFSNPEARKNISEKRKSYFANNPEEAEKNKIKAKEAMRTLEVRKIMSERKKSYIDEHPEEWAKQQTKAKEATQTPEARKEAAKRTKNFIANNPEKWKENRAKATITHSSQEARKSASERTKLYFSNPEARIAQSKSQKLRFSTPEARQAASESQKLRFSTPEAKARQSCAVATYYAKKANRPFSYLPQSINSNQ
jgi:hypothetical protein